MARRSLEVRRGDPITRDLVNRFAKATRANRLFPGHNVRLRQLPGGQMVSVQAQRGWTHPFQVALAGRGAQVRKGLLNLSIEPTIHDVPLSGEIRDNNHQVIKTVAPPTLAWKKLSLDDAGRGYIALEITCNKAWAIIKAEIVQCAWLDRLNARDPRNFALSGGDISYGGVAGLPGRKARHPLALLRQRKSGGIDLFQIVFFNLQHRLDVRSAAAEVARHFFFAGA